MATTCMAVPWRRRRRSKKQSKHKEAGSRPSRLSMDDQSSEMTRWDPMEGTLASLNAQILRFRSHSTVGAAACSAVKAALTAYADVSRTKSELLGNGRGSRSSREARKSIEWSRTEDNETRGRETRGKQSRGSRWQGRSPDEDEDEDMELDLFSRLPRGSDLVACPGQRAQEWTRREWLLVIQAAHVGITAQEEQQGKAGKDGRGGRSGRIGRSSSAGAQEQHSRGSRKGLDETRRLLEELLLPRSSREAVEGEERRRETAEGEEVEEASGNRTSRLASDDSRTKSFPPEVKGPLAKVAGTLSEGAADQASLITGWPLKRVPIPDVLRATHSEQSALPSGSGLGDHIKARAFPGKAAECNARVTESYAPATVLSFSSADLMSPSTFDCSSLDTTDSNSSRSSSRSSRAGGEEAEGLPGACLFKRANGMEQTTTDSNSSSSSRSRSSSRAGGKEAEGSSGAVCPFKRLPPRGTDIKKMRAPLACPYLLEHGGLPEAGLGAGNGAGVGGGRRAPHYCAPASDELAAGEEGRELCGRMGRLLARAAQGSSKESPECPRAEGEGEEDSTETAKEPSLDGACSQLCNGSGTGRSNDALTGSSTDAKMQLKLLQVSVEAHERLLMDKTANGSAVCGFLLEQLLSLTASDMGFIASVCPGSDDAPFLKTHAITNIGWTPELRRWYDENREQGMVFLNMDTLFGEVVKTSNTLISNRASLDSRSAGVPPGHPRIDTFLGVPLFADEELVGIYAVANNPEGYQESLVEQLKPLARTMGCIVADVRRRSKEEGDDVAPDDDDEQSSLWCPGGTPSTRSCAGDDSAFEDDL